ncbi:MAG TPA: xanthine dehydrogenase family protein subunit M, partial [Burkholderiales bacterium]|nr:xanthine dehydrogenase family protein subunit M [Burkholderiales bacterium]
FDAVLSVAGPLGQRTMTLDELYRLPEDTRRTETTLGENELIVAIRLSLQDEATRSIYLKAMDRAAFSFALAGVAAVVRLADDHRRIARARLVLSGVAPIPWRAQAAEAILAGAEPKPALFSIAADAALRGAIPLLQNGWKVPLLRSLIVRALERLTAKQNLSRA